MIDYETHITCEHTERLLRDKIAELKVKLMSQTKAKEFHLNTIKEIYDTQATQAKEIAELETVINELRNRKGKSLLIPNTQKALDKFKADAIWEMCSLHEKQYGSTTLYHAREYADKLEKSNV